MRGIFRLIQVPADTSGGSGGVCIALEQGLGGQSPGGALSKPFGTFEELSSYVEAIRKDLDGILGEAKGLFEAGPSGAGLHIHEDTPAEEIWSMLSGLEKEAHFLDSFNALEVGKRREVAEHVLTHCNVFSGKGSLFSARYNNESALLE